MTSVKPEPAALNRAASRPARARRPISRRSLHREVVETLRDMIVEGELKPGQRIDEGAVSEQLGVSRTPVREALKVLASEGLVELRPNRGTRVSEITAREVGELFEVVSGIEAMAAGLAARRMSEDDLERLRRLHVRMERHFEAGRRHEYFRLNHEIHLLVVRLAGNSVLAATHESLMVRVRRARYTAIQSPERWRESVDEHRMILEALAARDAERATALLGEHVQRTGDVVQTHFTSHAGEHRPRVA